MKEATKVKLHFPTGHLGASAGDNALDLVIRALSLKHAKEGEWADKYGTEYEDATILIHPDYQDEECTCGFRKIADQWHENNPHTRDCYRAVAWKQIDKIDAPFRRKIDRLIAKRNTLPLWGKESRPIQKQINAVFDEQLREERQYYRAMCKQYRIPWNKGLGCAVHCSCGTEERAKTWFAAHDHKERCPVALPNFCHKPTGVKVDWYKYIGRDMKCNVERIPADQWQQIASLVSEEDVKKVIDSAKEAQQTFAAMIEQVNQQQA